MKFSKANIEVAHFHRIPSKMRWLRIQSKISGTNYLATEPYVPKTSQLGNCFELGQVSYDLKDITEPVQLNLEVDRRYRCVNDWDFWVYPEKVEMNQGEVYVTDSLDSKTQQILEQGGNVLITAAGKISTVKRWFNTSLLCSGILLGLRCVLHIPPVYW